MQVLFILVNGKMKIVEKQKISFELTVYNSKEELLTDEESLMSYAVKAREDAYAPYSNFNVGAAILLENGEIVIGSNQENAAYPSGLCAERVAVFYAGAKYPGVAIKKIAVTAASENGKVETPVPPCGSCRQSLLEYENQQKEPIVLILMGENGKVMRCTSISDILPLAFNKSYLG